eukprot:TRINITY_DN13406_c0_g3_i2.p1 TRINITY_DN13406_c0_g3~~TRINITY_DN13406_c0_g3_i2.p1  ORF type:complete len:760 (+),score=306.93 TRINITY_DN13406_c0_g3_i2:736-3015(+)
MKPPVRREAPSTMTRDLRSWLGEVTELKRSGAIPDPDQEGANCASAGAIDSDDERELKQRVDQGEKRLAESEQAARHHLASLAAVVQDAAQRVDTLRSALAGALPAESVPRILEDTAKPPAQLGIELPVDDQGGSSAEKPLEAAAVATSSPLPQQGEPVQQDGGAEQDVGAQLASVESAVKQLMTGVCLWAHELRTSPRKYQGAAPLQRKSSAPLESMREDDDDEDKEEGDAAAAMDGPPAVVGSRILMAAKESMDDDDRYDEGLPPAARAAGYSLTPAQVKEILHHFYHQPKQPLSAPMKKKREIRLQRRYVDTLKREAEQVSKLRRINVDVRQQLLDAKREIAMLKEQEKAMEGSVPATIRSDGTAGGEWVSAVELCRRGRQMLDREMSGQRIKDLELHVRKLSAMYDAEKEGNEDSSELYEKLQADYLELSRELNALKAQWDEKEREFQRQRLQIDRLQQGRKEKDQLWRSRLLEVCRGVLDAMAELPLGLSLLRGLLVGSESVDKWRATAIAAVDGGIDTAYELVQQTIKYVPAEGYKITLEELQAQLLAEKDGRVAQAARPQRGSVTAVFDCGGHEPFDRRLFEQLHEKIEMLATENRSKFRELRYMKSVIAYVCKTSDEIVSGTYDYSRDTDAEPAEEGPQMSGASGDFPPDVAREDKDYAYAWIDERKLMQELLTNLKRYVRHGGAKPNSVNSLMGVLGSWREALPAQPQPTYQAGPPQTSHFGQTASSSGGHRQRGAAEDSRRRGRRHSET